ncbi:DNA polymerase III subunit alpha [Candidatus Gracilibacteria bacterium]|nr:DNA polymerase III subunit alpha [Candidatus Gracilibacteria bacterium]
MPKAFVNLHTHSFYSLLEATASPTKILTKAKEWQYPAVALTDTGGGYGLLEFYEEAQRIGDVKPILGVEIAVSSDSRFERRAGMDGREGHIVLLARNTEGYKNLLQLLSYAYLEGFYYKPRVDWELLEEYKKGLFVLTGATGGLLGKAFSDQGEKKAIEVFDRIRKIFGKENVLCELVSRKNENQKKLNIFVSELSRSSGCMPIVTSDARFLEMEDEESADVLFCIGKNIKVSDLGRVKFAEGNWFKTFEEIEKELSGYIDKDFLEQCRQNTLEVAEQVELKLEFDQNLLPHFEVKKGETEASQLRGDCEKNLEVRYGKNYPKSVLERLEYELSVIGKMGFEAYFLIVADFIHFARENGIAVGPGRGSAAGSIVSYLLGITNVDPLKYELLFERFLNPERISMPDIDIDFSDERRDEVLQYVVEKYGDERVSRVCTFGTMSARAALKDVGRALGVPFAEMNALTKLLPNRPGFTLEMAEKVKDFKTLIETNDQLKKVSTIAYRLEGCVRHVSVHACAVIIGQNDLRQSTPIQWAPGDEKIKITQFPYQQLEHVGLLKMDFLGLKNLSVLEKTVNNIRATTGEELDMSSIPIDDEKTFRMLAEGETTGVFQFESAGMRRYLRELKPTEFEDLVAMNALYRPGPMEYIPTYIEGKHHPEKIVYMHPILEPILKKTYGIAVYQEQILKIAREFAGFSLGEADILRKAIGKKIASILSKQRQRFIDGAIAQGYDKKLAIKIFDEIVVPFSGYGFNRSHAVCYARIAYETAYLRANYPVEFMAAMMTTDRHNTDRIVLEMNECRDMNIEVLPPSINQSGSYFTVIQEEGNRRQASLDVGEQQIRDKKIRFGLTAIKGLGEETVDQIIFERKANGAFGSLQEFAKRVPAKLMNKKTLEALTFSGAFDSFGDRKAIADSLEDLVQFSKEHENKTNAGQMGLFGGVDTSAVEFTLRNTVATKDDILRWERESLGLFVTDHPLRGLNDYFQKYGTLIGTLSDTEDVGKKRTIHGIVTDVRKILTRRGKNMAILELEDTSGKMETAIFPQVYDSIPAGVFELDAFLRVRGKIEERDGKLNMIVDEIQLGNLQKVGKWNGEQEELSLQEEKSDLKSLPPLVIKIPEGILKEKVRSLKIFLQSLKIDVGGVAVEIYMNGQKIPLPFRIKLGEKDQEKIQKILK